MEATDRGTDELSFDSVWRSLAGRLAAAAGSLVALLSLIQHVPVDVACLRGGAAWLAASIVARLGRVAVERAMALDRSRAVSDAPADGEEPSA